MGNVKGVQSSNQSLSFSSFGQPTYTGGISGYGSGIHNVMMRPWQMYPPLGIGKVVEKAKMKNKK
jgi:hypothetical protein